jgi:ABC-type transporter Mla MlaB component
MASSSVAERISTGRGAGRRTIGLRGPLKGPMIGALREKALAAIEPDIDLIVDMSEVTAIDAEGLAVLDEVAIRARADGGSFFVRPPAADKALFEAVAAVTMSATEMARRDHPAGRGG